MGIRSRIDVLVDLLTKRVQVGELAMAATSIGADITFGRDPDDGSKMIAHIRHQEHSWGSTNLWRLVYLQALCDGTTAEHVLSDIRRDLEREGLATEAVPLEDTRTGKTT